MKNAGPIILLLIAGVPWLIVAFDGVGWPAALPAGIAALGIVRFAFLD
jgi:hypothetical protein